MELTTRQRAEAGARLLDEHVEDWAGRVDPASLNMAYAKTCVLGQLFGDYDTGCHFLDGKLGEEFDVFDHGFDSYTEGDTPEHRAECKWLDEDWRFLINDRVSGLAVIG